MKISVHTWMRHVPVRRRLRHGSTGMLAALLVGGLVVAIPPEAAEARTNWAAPLSADVKGVKVKPVTVIPRADWSATAREVTEANLPAELPEGSQTVSLIPTRTSASAQTSLTVKAGGLPVYLTPVAARPATGALAAPDQVGSVRVDVGSKGVAGLTVALSRVDGVKQAGEAKVTVDYRRFARAYGGEWASRLQVVRLSDGATIPSVNDPRNGTITATAALAASGAATTLAVAAAASGTDGDYKATSLAAASTWQVSQQTGSFGWAYPIEVPDAPAGPAPSLSLSYSSQSVDGRTAGTNSQGSWIGDGWDMWPGYIERQYRGCTDDRDEDEKANPNNKAAKGGDLCWMGDNGNISLNGSSTELVKVASSYSGTKDEEVLYRGVKDDGSRIEQLKDGRDNDDVDGTYWRVTTADGTQYFFGRDNGQGGATAGTKTDSVWTVPVYSNHPDEPGYDQDFKQSRKQRAWRWNLDHVVDPSGNTITYFYGKEGGAYAREADADLRTTYDRGGYLKRVEYGSRVDAPVSARPAARVVFDLADRCVGTPCVTGGKAVARRFPDTPWDQYCAAAPCRTQFAPTFWTQKRLSKVTTQVYAGSGDTYTSVDSWDLVHTYLMAGVNEGLPMYLRSIRHTGLVTSAGGPVETDPAVVFDPTAEYMPNRVDGPDDGHSSLFRNRVSTITSESGAQIGITYSAPQCTRGTLPKEHENTKRCFPQYYGAEGETPKLDWFHTYVVTRVDVYDNTGGFEHEQTNYRYLDTPAWAYDDSELVKPKKRTWSQYRGYGRVEIRKGTEDGVQSRVEYRYFRGMDGDKQPKSDKERPPTGTPRDVAVTDSLGGTLPDHPAYSGDLREEITYNGVGGDWVAGRLLTPAVTGPVVTSGALTAYRTYTRMERGRTRLSDGSTRWTKVVNTVDAENFVTEVNDFGDEGDPNDDRCSTNEYARDNGRWILATVNRTETLSVNCDATSIVRPRDVLSDVRTYFDDDETWGKAPTRGLSVRVDVASSYTGSTPEYTTSARMSHDPSGRTLTSSDALGRVTKWGFVPATGGPVTQTTVTGPTGNQVVTTLNAALGKPVKTVADTAVTEMTYDGSGRVLAVWAPGRPKSANLKAPTESYSYKMRNNASSFVVTKTLMPYGNGTYRTSVSLLDGLGRTRQTQTQTPAGGRAITDAVYDSRGLLDWTSSPYYDIDNTAPNTVLVTTQGRPEIPTVTDNIHDGTGRLTDAILLDRGNEAWRTHTDHNGERVTVTPPDGAMPTTTIADGRGRTVELRQYKARANAGSDVAATFDRTSYTYDARDAILRTTGPGGNVWSYEYDQLGRRTVENDPDHGTSVFSYDRAGQLLRSEDAKGQVLAYEYDTLGRQTVMRKDKADGPKLAEWVYDTLPNGKGKLSSSTRYEYDATGKPQAWVSKVTGYEVTGAAKGTSLTVPSSETGMCASGMLDPCTYSVGFKYRPSGDIDQVVYPAIGGLKAETLTTLYNQVGLVSSIIGEIAGDNQIYAQESVYNQFDQLILQNLGEHGSRVALAYGYDELTGRKKSFLAVPELKPDIYNLAYTYSHAGRLTSINDSPDENQPGETQCFSYDHLQRLTEAWTPTSRNCGTARSTSTLGGPAPYWRSYTYDGSGNRKTETVHAATAATRTYGYPAAGGGPGSKPHAVTSVTGSVSQQYAYDAVGNTVCRPAADMGNTCAADGTAGAGSQQVTWNSEGSVQKIKDTTGDTSFVYDAGGGRMLRRDPTGTTLYLPGGTELRKPKSGTATATRYYASAGATIAVRTAAGVQWQVSDHQGTASASVGNDTQRAVSRRRMLPFGDVRGAQPTGWMSDKGLVGGTRDNTGLTHLGAREYDPKLGRFISVDPLIDITDPQQWNGYDYADNSPVSSSDATGMRSCSDDRCGPGADYVDLSGDYVEVDGHNDGCHGCSGTGDSDKGGGNRSGGGNSSGSSNGSSNGWNYSFGSSSGFGSGKFVKVAKPQEQKRNVCTGWAMWCKGKKLASSGWDQVKKNKGKIAGVFVGVVIGVGCTALTGGAGAIVCGAIGGAASSLTSSLIDRDSLKDTAINTATGFVFGGAGGALGAGFGGFLQGAAARGLQASALKPGLAVGGNAVKKAWPWAGAYKAEFGAGGVRASIGGSLGEVRGTAQVIGKGATLDMYARGLSHMMRKHMFSPSKSLAPALVSAVMPGDAGDLDDYQIQPANMIGPMLSGGLS